MIELSRRHLMTGAATLGAASTLGIAPSAFAAAPPVGKQNASWYRYKVGDFEVTAVADGVTNAPLIDNYVVNASKADVNAALEADFLPKDRALQSYTPVVVNTGSKLVAIDTGLGMGMFEQSKGAVGNYHNNLQAAGIDRNAVDVVIISHFHGDHINGLVAPDNKLAFPNAEIMVPEAEWAFWSDESNTPKLPEIARGQMGNVKRVFGVVGSKVTKYQPGKELVPGITAIETRGHTPGHCSHLITSGSGKLLVQADVMAGMASIYARYPEWQFVFDTEKEIAVQTRRKIYDMAAADKIPIQGFHFYFPSVCYVQKTASGYGLVPAPWATSI
ncbi:MAG: MBL fold metallo-hydrolase [Pseudolabrys sp.]|nr:MBL fold metallo-hydrolase [Pseudolabrys sp.]